MRLAFGPKFTVVILSVQCSLLDHLLSTNSPLYIPVYVHRYRLVWFVFLIVIFAFMLHGGVCWLCLLGR